MHEHTEAHAHTHTHSRQFYFTGVLGCRVSPRIEVAGRKGENKEERERVRKTERVRVNMEGVKENDKTDKDLKREGGGRWRETERKCQRGWRGRKSETGHSERSIILLDIIASLTSLIMSC